MHFTVVQQTTTCRQQNKKYTRNALVVLGNLKTDLYFYFSQFTLPLPVLKKYIIVFMLFEENRYAILVNSMKTGLSLTRAELSR